MTAPRLSSGARLGVILVSIFLFAAIFGPWLAPYSPEAQNLERLLEMPSRAHWLGTDENGCDLLSQLLYGARLAAGISLAVVILCLFIGTLLGTVAGYFGGLIDEII